jgi:hypothetical protein
MEGTCTILGVVLVLGIGGIIITVGYFCAEIAVVTVEEFEKVQRGTEVV